MQIITNLNKFDKAITDEVIKLIIEFETNKRQRKIRESPYIINQNENKENEDKNDPYSENGDDEDKKNVIKSPDDELEILEMSGLTNNKKEEGKENAINPVLKNMIGNNPMFREIELYVQKNMDEMYTALEEL